MITSWPAIPGWAMRYPSHAPTAAPSGIAIQ